MHLQVQYSLLSAGPAQSAIKAVADDLGIVLIAYSPLALGLLTGKYDAANLPRGPRGSLFKQLLPGIAPLTSALGAVAAARRKTVSQVRSSYCSNVTLLRVVGGHVRRLKVSKAVGGPYHGLQCPELTTSHQQASFCQSIWLLCNHASLCFLAITARLARPLYIALVACYSYAVY